MFPVWIASFAASFLVFAAIGIAQIGWTSFHEHLLDPEVNGAAYDLLMASLAGTYAVGITVYLGGVATVIVTVSDRNNRRHRALLEAIGSWWLFFPTLFWFLTTNLLVGSAWGFPGFWVGVLVLMGIGPLALLSLSKLAANVATLFSEEGGIVTTPATPTPEPRGQASPVDQSENQQVTAEQPRRDDDDTETALSEEDRSP